MLYRGYRQAIKNMRARIDQTQEQCAARADMNAKKWSQYETGVLKLTRAVLPDLCQGLGCTETELWQETVRVQSQHYFSKADEVREEAPKYGTSQAAGVLQGLFALDIEALPAEERGPMLREQHELAAGLSSMLSLIDIFKDRYWHLMEFSNTTPPKGDNPADSND